jgi:hypothetical protein
VIASESLARIWDERSLIGSHLLAVLNQPLKWIAFNVEFRPMNPPYDCGNWFNIVGANVSLVGSRVDGDSICPGLERDR